MKILVPLTITNAMLSSSTIAEPAAGEAIWAAATSYVVGQRAILTATHRIYENLIAGVNATSPDLALTGTTPRWMDVGPTNRWSAFDGVVSTGSSATTSLTYVLLPGFFSSLAFYGLVGSTISISIKTAPGGTVFYTYSGDLLELPVDYYDYYFGTLRQLSKLILDNILTYANPEMTVTISAAAGAPVAVGMIAIGTFYSLIGADSLGGTEYGATAEPITYSYIKTDIFGTTKIIRRHSATNMNIRVILPQNEADAALQIVQSVLDVPAAWVASAVPGYDGLNVFGLGSGGMNYAGPNHALFSLNIKGFI